MSDMAPPDRHLAAEAVVVLGAIALAIPFLLSTYVTDDELNYNSLANGMRIAHGQVLYRDFFEFGAPLPSWIAAALYGLFGPRVLAARVLQDALLVLSAWQTHRLARWLGAGPWLAVLPAWVVLACLHPFVPGYGHHWLVLPLVQGALLAALRAGEGLAGWWRAGLWGGLALITMQSDGIVLAVALGAYAALGGWLGGEARPAGRPLRELAIGWVVPVALAIGVLAAQGALGAAYQDVWRWTTTHYRMAGGINDIMFLSDLARGVGAMTGVHFGRQLYYLAVWRYLGVAFVPLAVAGLGALWGLGLLAARRHGRAATPLERRFALVVLLAIGLFAVALRGRADISHVALYAWPALLVAAALAAIAWRQAPPVWRPAAAAPVLALAVFLAAGLASREFALVRLPVGPVAFGPDQRASYDRALAYLKAHARPGDRLVAVPTGGYYYFYGLPPAVHLTTIFDKASRYYTPAEIDAFWREVASARARFLLVDASHEPFMADAVPGVPPGYRVVFRGASQRYYDARVTIYELDAPVVSARSNR